MSGKALFIECPPAFYEQTLPVINPVSFCDEDIEPHPLVYTLLETLLEDKLTEFSPGEVNKIYKLLDATFVDLGIIYHNNRFLIRYHLDLYDYNTILLFNTESYDAIDLIMFRYVLYMLYDYIGSTMILFNHIIYDSEQLPEGVLESYKRFCKDERWTSVKPNERIMEYVCRKRPVYRKLVSLIRYMSSIEFAETYEFDEEYGCDISTLFNIYMAPQYMASDYMQSLCDEIYNIHIDNPCFIVKDTICLPVIYGLIQNIIKETCKIFY